VADHLQFSNDTVQCNITFIISVHDWEVDSITSIYILLYLLSLRRGGKDKICWIPSTREVFDVRSFYNLLIPPMTFSLEEHLEK